QGEGRPQGPAEVPRGRSPADGSAGWLRTTKALTAVWRPAAARRAGQGPGEPAGGPAPGRAAGSAGPQAAAGDADRAEVDPAAGWTDVRLRHPRPGGGAHHERPPGGDQRGPVGSLGSTAGGARTAC